MSALPWEFIVRQGPEQGQRISVPSEQFVIGSHPDCEVRFPANTVRERHAEVRRVDGVFEAVDLTGASLMWVDGQPAAKAELFSGSVLRVGRVELLFVSLEETASIIPDSTERALPKLTFENSPNADVPVAGSGGGGALAALNKATPLFSSVADAHRVMNAAGAPATSDAPSSSSGKFVVGDVIDGRYRIMQRIAAGGMGEVYRAEHVELGKALALKVMLPTLNADQEFVNRFKIEAVAASRIGHPNIIDISDFGRTVDGRFYFAMEFLDGLTLSSLVHRHGAQSPGRSVSLILQAARALAAAHELHIIHRDLKPDNVMVLQRPGNPDLVKVLDFGVARVEVDQESIGKTAAGIVVGTPQYMSPEQAKAIVVDVRSDIYSLGLILYELLAGKPAFTGETPPIVMVKQVTEPPPPLPDWVPEELVELVMHMLEKDPAARPQKMSEVVERLEAMRRSLKTSDFEAKPAGQTVERTPTPARPASGRRAVTTKTPARAPTPTRPGTPRPSSQKLAIEPAPARTIATEGLSLNETVPIPTLPKPAPVGATEEELPPVKSSRAPLVVGVVLAVAALAGGAVLLTREDPPVVKEPVEVVVVPPEPKVKPPVEPPGLPELSIRVETTPPGAQVVVGKEPLGTTPLTLTRKKGEVVELQVSLEGYQSETKSVTVGDETKTVSLVLQKTKAAPKPPEPTPDQPKPDGKATGDKPKPDAKPTPDQPKPDGKATGDKPKPDVKPTPDKPKPKPKKDDLKDVPF
ncbi:MAG: protein kinase [Myxococcaceae bacterium]|jgi:serine/threonine-protein kinase|nr:protein kinase [Myxococcaceae bacterium]